ncbi:MAG: hypothetical protein JWP49_599 [Phenylobacterium sp.]|jgi:hypothetical protein|nr:hypothetical protein [Phenylobacterium sp.]
MNASADMTERHGRLLARFAEQAASLAEDLCAAGLAAETLAEKQAATGAFHRAGRAMRLAIALEARLVRDARRQQQEELVAAQDAVAARKTRRRDQVKATVERLIWMEHEKDGEDADHLVECLGERLGEDLLHDDFDAEPLETHIAQLCESLGLPSPLAGEGVGQSPTEEGSHGDADSPSSTDPDSPAKPLIRPDGNGLRPQGEKDDELLSDDYWRASG